MGWYEIKAPHTASHTHNEEVKSKRILRVKRLHCLHSSVSPILEVSSKHSKLKGNRSLEHRYTAGKSSNNPPRPVLSFTVPYVALRFVTPAMHVLPRRFTCGSIPVLDPVLPPSLHYLVSTTCANEFCAPFLSDRKL